jgi:hypothetical protein
MTPTLALLDLADREIIVGKTVPAFLIGLGKAR